MTGRTEYFEHRLEMAGSECKLLQDLYYSSNRVCTCDTSPHTDWL